ncbi:MAG TPA: protein kinase [Candidatus Polarisedimenticolaceae bacterium]|nr:protein kinase [Candidatus Polarisedimenticolaceae bacterium]
MNLAPGTRLLHYRLIDKIGEGGMGAVWRARDTTLEREVAIKVLPEQVAHDGERLSRFDREAKLLAQLNHPNIAAIYGFHRAGEDNLAFLAMELVEGEDLARRLARGPLPVDEALDVFRQIAEALEAAHERGVVHRDLKPANVKLTPDGKVKVLDFGLAKAMSPDTASGGSDVSLSPTMTSDRTRAGVILGTAAYMSPEQARGRSLDRRTDLWSFGCVMHECLTGTQIFRGETVSDSLAAILRKEIDWSELPAGVAPGVRRLVARCLTRDPRKRLQDAGDARVELEQAIEEPSAAGVAVAPPVPLRVVRLVPWLVAVLAVVVAVSLWLRGSQPVSSGASIARRLTIPVPGPTRFGDLAASPPAISPDGRLIVFGVTDKGETKLWMRPLSDFGARPVAGAEGGQYAFWSPDSKHVGFFRGGRLRRIELATGREQAIGGEGSSYPRGASWNARGQIVFAPNSNAGIYLIDAAGGEPRPITTPDPAISDSSHRWPWFLPDGEHFLFTLWTNDPEARRQHGGVYVGSIAGDEPPRRLVPDASNAAFVPPDHLLLARGDALVAFPFDVTALRVEGDPAVVADDVLGNNSNGYSAFSVSEDGTLVYATGQAVVSSSLRWYDRTGAVTDTPVEPASFRNTRLAPGAGRAATVIPGPTGDGEIWIVDLVRGVRMRLAHGAVTYEYPVWSRDGSRILFAGQIGAGLDLFTRRSDGSGAEEPVLVDGRDKSLYDWSRDGKYAAYWPTGAGGGTPDIWIYSIERQAAVPLITGEPVYEDARFSPDGRWIAYVSDDSGRREVFVQALEGEDRTTAGARWQASTAGGVFPHWRDDGRELLYLDLQQRVVAVSIETAGSELEIGAPVELFALDGVVIDMDATGDHRRLLVAAEESVRTEPLRVVLDWPAEIAGR